MNPLKMGINVCASQKLNVNFGPVISSFGTKPLKKLPNPSLRAMLPTMRRPLSGFSKLRFWMRVLMTSRGALTMMLALLPANEATKFCDHVAEL